MLDVAREVTMSSYSESINTVKADSAYALDENVPLVATIFSSRFCAD